jgi:hypothetical protein
MLIKVFFICPRVEPLTSQDFLSGLVKLSETSEEQWSTIMVTCFKIKQIISWIKHFRKFQIFIFLIWYINVNKGVFYLIISYLRIKSYNVLNYNNRALSVVLISDQLQYNVNNLYIVLIFFLNIPIPCYIFIKHL